MVISNITLVKIAAVGGVATCTMGLLYNAKLQSNIKATVYYKDAFKTLRKNREALDLLGEPITECGINVEDKKRNYTNQNSARYEVPLKGSKRRGLLCFQAERESGDSDWIVKNVELELKNNQKKKIIIKLLPN